jgi:hypothetical protein
MTVGEGIFYSALLFSFVFLYVSTKDRWNWKKLIVWVIGGLVAVSILLGVGLYLYLRTDDRPRKEMAFWGVPLGAPKSDVKFLKGEPRPSSDEDYWTYVDVDGNKESSYSVNFVDGKVDFVLFRGSSLYAPSIQGISDYSNQEAIKTKFGEPTLVSRSKDETRRLLSYSQYNVAFVLRENRVIALGIFNGTRRAGLQFKDAAE